MGILWDFHGISMRFPWNFHGISMEFPWDFHGISLDSYEVYMRFDGTSFMVQTNYNVLIMRHIEFLLEKDL